MCFPKVTGTNGKEGTFTWMYVGHYVGLDLYSYCSNQQFMFLVPYEQRKWIVLEYHLLKKTLAKRTFRLYCKSLYKSWLWFFFWPWQRERLLQLNMFFIFIFPQIWHKKCSQFLSCEHNHQCSEIFSLQKTISSEKNDNILYLHRLHCDIVSLFCKELFFHL